MEQYKGLTRRQYKRRHQSQTPGREKSETCQATGLDKAMAKYPRNWKTHTEDYIEFYKKKFKAARIDNYYGK